VKISNLKIINYSGHGIISVLRHLAEFPGSEFEDGWLDGWIWLEMLWTFLTISCQLIIY